MSYFSGLARDLGIVDAPITDDAVLRDVQRRTEPVRPTVYVHPAPEKPVMVLPKTPVVPGGGTRMPTSLTPEPETIVNGRSTQLTPAEHAEIDRAELLETPTLLMALAIGGGLLWLLSRR